MFIGDCVKYDHSGIKLLSVKIHACANGCVVTCAWTSRSLPYSIQYYFSDWLLQNVLLPSFNDVSIACSCYCPYQRRIYKFQYTMEVINDKVSVIFFVCLFACFFVCFFREIIVCDRNQSRLIFMSVQGWCMGILAITERMILGYIGAAHSYLGGHGKPSNHHGLSQGITALTRRIRQ